MRGAVVHVSARDGGRCARQVGARSSAVASAPRRPQNVGTICGSTAAGNCVPSRVIRRCRKRGRSQRGWARVERSPIACLTGVTGRGRGLSQALEVGCRGREAAHGAKSRGGCRRSGRHRPLHRRAAAGRLGLARRRPVTARRGGWAALSPYRGRSARCGRLRRQAGGSDGRHTRLLRRVPARPGRRGGLCRQHRPQPRHARQRRHGHRRRIAGAPPRRAGDRHQVLRLASGAFQDAGARERPAPHAARLLLRPDRLADGVPARQALGLGGAAPADAVRLRARHAHEHPAGDRRLRRRSPGSSACRCAFPASPAPTARSTR